MFTRINKRLSASLIYRLFLEKQHLGTSTLYLAPIHTSIESFDLINVKIPGKRGKGDVGTVTQMWDKMCVLFVPTHSS